MAPKTILLILHILGVVWGVGGVLMLDVHLLRHLRGNGITSHDVRFTRFVSAFVKVGLVVVWASGLAVIGIAPDGPAAVLANPKLQAKLIVVVVLTVNALFVETLALPLLESNLGRPLFDGVGQVRRSMVLGCAAVSTLSWSYPVVLGLARELNQVTPAQTILVYYLSLLLGAAVVTQVAGRLFYRPARGSAAAAARVPGAEPDAPASDRVAAGRAGEAVRRRADGALAAARRAGQAALGGDMPALGVADAFGALVTEAERRQFREGLFTALRDRLGREKTADELMAAVAGDALIRGKVAAVAPHGAARRAFDANMDRAARPDDRGRWAEVRDWHESLMGFGPRDAAACEPAPPRTMAAG